MQKNILFTAIITCAFLILTSNAFTQSNQIIHGDTIYYEASSYYLIDGDTMRLDPGHITLEYVSSTSEQQKSSIEGSYLLTELLTTYKGRVVYKTHPSSDYLNLLSSLPNENSIENLFL